MSNPDLAANLAEKVCEEGRLGSHDQGAGVGDFLLLLLILAGAWVAYGTFLS